MFSCQWGCQKEKGLYKRPFLSSVCVPGLGGVGWEGVGREGVGMGRVGIGRVGMRRMDMRGVGMGRVDGCCFPSLSSSAHVSFGLH